MAANPILQAPTVDVPRHVWDAVNNAIHTSKIDGNLQPISLCYVAVRAALAAYLEPTPEHPRADCEGCNKPDCPCNADARELEPIDVLCPQCQASPGNRCRDWVIGVYEYTSHNARIYAAKKAVSA